MAVNVVEVVPAGTMIELGTGSRASLLDSNTSFPPAGAALFNVTVHVVDTPDCKLVGVQTSWETELICPKAAAPEDKKTAIAELVLILNLRTITYQNLPGSYAEVPLNTDRLIACRHVKKLQTYRV